MKKHLFLSKGRGLLLVALALTIFSGAQAQNTAYIDDENHYYQSVATIYEDEASVYGPGYAIANTLGSNDNPYGEVIRVNPFGNQNWVYKYWGPDEQPVRFTHIEKFHDEDGNLFFLVIGSIANPPAATTDLLVLVLDDFGSPVGLGRYPGRAYPHLVGTKGIVTRDGKYFAVVGFEGNGFDVTDDKHAFIVQIDRSNFSIVSSLVLNTPHIGNDHDIATSLAEGRDSDHFVVVGSANNPQIAPSQSTTLITHVRMSPPTIIGSYNFATAFPDEGGWDGAADVVYDGIRDFWVLSNSSKHRYYNLTRYDGLFSGNTIQILPTRDDEVDYYGYELKPSLIDNRLIIGGWKNEGAAVFPFLAEFDIPNQGITWEARYGLGNNAMAAFFTNPWLFVQANNNLFPYYYNSLANYRFDQNGYSILDSDHDFVGLEHIKLWWGIGIAGAANKECGYVPQRVIPRKIETPVYPTPRLVEPLEKNIKVEITWKESPYEEAYCDGELYKAKQLAGISETQANGINVYPNPSAAVFQVNSETAISEVAVIDISLGKRLLTQKAENAHSVSLDLKDLAPGVYLLQVSGTNHELSTHKITIVR